MRPLPHGPDLDFGLDLDHAKISDGDSFSRRDSDHIDYSAPILSPGNVSEAAKPTEVTPLDEGDYDANRAPPPAHAPRCSRHDQGRDDLLSQAQVGIGQTIMVRGSCVDNEAFSNGDPVKDALIVALTGTAKDPFVVKFGPGRDGHRGGASNKAQGSYTEKAGEAEIYKGSSLVDATLDHPNKSTYEVGKAIQWAERLSLLSDWRTTSEVSGVKQHSSCGLFTPTLNNLMPPEHLCATEDEPWSCVSSTARETQVHELENAIHRLMPSNRIIYFGVDRDSFKLGGVPEEVTNRVISAAQEIVSHIEKGELGINFSYDLNSNSNAFNIFYDQSLKRQTLARAFFPSDSRADWKLRISKTLIFSKSELDYLPNILAHEFMHILGLRHWNAGTCEAEERSFQWPNTKWQDKDSVMITGVHPSKIWFFPEDLRVVREIYSYQNGDVVAGRNIIDVHP